jgi:hypothetical protein
MNTVHRRDDVVVQEIDRETMVYDPLTAEFHLLHPLAAFVFRRADGQMPLARILDEARVTLGGELSSADMDVAVAELERVNLLRHPESVEVKRVTRRAMMQRLAAAAVLAVPLITTMAAPAAAMGVSKPRSPLSSVSPPSPISPVSKKDEEKKEEDKEKLKDILKGLKK